MSNRGIDIHVKMHGVDHVLAGHRRSWRIHDRIFGSGNRVVATEMVEFSRILKREGRLTEALDLQQEVFQRRRHRYGSEDVRTLYAEHDTATLLSMLARNEQAKGMLAHAFERGT